MSSIINTPKNDTIAIEDPNTASSGGSIRRRRSTFYVSLGSDSVKSQTTKLESKRNHPPLVRKSIATTSLDASKKDVNKTAVESTKIPLHQTKSLQQPRSFRLKSGVSVIGGTTSKSATFCGDRPDDELPVTKAVVKAKTVEIPKPQTTQIKTVNKPSQPIRPPQCSEEPTPKTKSPLLRVSSKLLSSSVQALEALSRNSSGSSESVAKSSTGLGSPLSLIRKASSRKLSRSSSNIVTRNSSNRLSSKQDHFFHTDAGASDISTCSIIQIDEPPNDRLLARCMSSGANSKLSNQFDEDAVHSDTSYEKACRRGSAPSTPVLANKSLELTPSKIVNFFSKRSFRSNPLKRTKSVTKLERKKGTDNDGNVVSIPPKLRTSRSHESLLSGQSQSAMQTLDLSSGGVDIKPLHPSVVGKEHCFQVTLPAGNARYFSCRTADERDKWVYSLRKSVQPDKEHTRRTDNSLKIWLLEAKGIPNKKKYFCELWLDKTLYAKTSAKHKIDLCFWGEHFEFHNLPTVGTININLCREGDKRRKRDKSFLVGTISIPVHEVNSKFLTERWYPIVMEKTLQKESPALRVKCRFQTVDILPVQIYQEFLQYLKTDYKMVCETLEPVISVKAKEDIATALVHIMQKEGLAKDFLADIVMLDIKRIEDERLVFRGNSLATKAMEAFLKLTGERYLHDTLSYLVSDVLQPGYECEVDPLKASSAAALTRQQQNLRDAVEKTWNNIVASSNSFPLELRECFTKFREQLNQIGRQDMNDNLISACIFLRFLCPAILSPSLFNITREYPDEKGARNLTLVAKTLQTLANFTRFQGKENFMEFMNDFLVREAPAMKQFLQSISSPLPDGVTPPTSSISTEFEGIIDLGKQLSILHSLLLECIPKVAPAKLKDMDRLHCLLERVGFAMTQPASILRQFDSLSDQAHVQNYHSLQRNIFRFNDPTVCPNVGINSLYAHCNGTAANNIVPGNGTMLKEANSSPSTVRSATLPRNAYLTSPTSNQMTIHNNDESMASFNGHTQDHHPQYNHHHHHQYNIKQHLQHQPQQQQSLQQPSSMQQKLQPTHHQHPSLNNARINAGNNNNVAGNGNNNNSNVRPEDYSDDCDMDIYRKGSQVSISTLSNVASSGYQSFTAYSQSSSPVDLSVQSNNSSSGSSSSNGVTGAVIGNGGNGGILHHNHGGENYHHHHHHLATNGDTMLPNGGSNYNNSNNNNANTATITNSSGNNLNCGIQTGTNITTSSGNGLPPLAFANPVYQHRLSRKQRQPSCSSSSDENNTDNTLDYASVNGTQRLHHGALRMPRTNPQCNGVARNTTSLWRSSGTPSESRIPHRTSFVNGGISNEMMQTCHQDNVRRLSVDSARDVTDSSDEENHDTRTAKLHVRRNIDQYEHEIERLQSSVDLLKLKLEQAEHQLDDSSDRSPPSVITEPERPEADNMKNIIARLISVEEELRREQRKMSDTLSHKQRVIEAQEHQIAVLDAANTRLLAAMNQLKERYQGPPVVMANPVNNNGGNCNGNNSKMNNNSQRLLEELSELKSSSC